MPAANPKPHKASKFFDLKVLIATLALAVTILFWNLFSNQAAWAEKIAAQQPDALEQPAGQVEGLPPLPTVAPLMEVNLQTAPAAVEEAVVPAGDADLRAVDAPASGVIVQKFAPVIADSSPAIGGGGGGSKSSGSRAVRRTRTS